jgi:Glycosyl hydrolase family 62
MKHLSIATLLFASVAASLAAEPPAYHWRLDAPLLNLAASDGGKPVQLFDPVAVFADGMWHVFGGGPQYFALKELKPGSVVPRSVKMSAEKLFVPQVFFFRPTKQWQMIGQIPDTTGRYPKSAPVLSTSARIDDPQGWSQPIVLDVPPPEDAEPIKNWMDFHIICDDTKAHLFATSSGKLWRSETKIADYPKGWSKPVVALAGDFIYASHTYRQDTTNGQPRYWLNITGVSVDATTKQRRQYQQSYIADHIEGPWRTEAATWDKPFAGPTNIRFTDDRWHGDLVHGEPLRLGNDERLILERDITGFIFHGHLRDATTGRMADKSESVGLLERESSLQK